MSEAAERTAANEVVLREVNERIAEKTSDLEARGLSDGDEPSEYLCSCGQVDCDVSIELTLEQFEAAHVREDRFVVAPGHDDPAIEDVVERYETYSIVRKKPGFKPQDLGPDV
jgi:hypothetical protein